MLEYIWKIHGARKEEKGASAVEYGLLVAAIAAIIVLLVFAIGTMVKGGFKKTCDDMNTGITSHGGTGATCPA